MHYHYRKKIIWRTFWPQRKAFQAGGRYKNPITTQQNHQRAPNPPEFAQPRLSRVKGRSSPARGYKFGCVCSYMTGHYSDILHDRPYRNKHTQICTPSLGTTALGPYANGAVQIRVGLESAETMSTTEIFPLWAPFFRQKKRSLLEQGGVCSLFPNLKYFQCMESRSCQNPGIYFFATCTRKLW